MTQLGSKDIFAKNLAYYLKRSDKTQKELAEILGVGATTVNEWMQARKFPRIDKIEMIANYFGVTKADLIEEKTDTAGAGLSVAKRKLIDIAKDCSDEDAERLLTMMQLFLKKK